MPAHRHSSSSSSPQPPSVPEMFARRHKQRREPWYPYFKYAFTDYALTSTELVAASILALPSAEIRASAALAASSPKPLIWLFHAAPNALAVDDAILSNSANAACRFARHV